MLAAVLAAAVVAQPLAFSVRVEPARFAGGEAFRAVAVWTAPKTAGVRINRRGLLGREVFLEIKGAAPVTLRKPPDARPLLDGDFIDLAAGEKLEYAYPLNDWLDAPILKPGRYQLKARYRNRDARSGAWTGELAASAAFVVLEPKP